MIDIILYCIIFFLVFKFCIYILIAIKAAFEFIYALIRSLYMYYILGIPQSQHFPKLKK